MKTLKTTEDLAGHLQGRFANIQEKPASVALNWEPVSDKRRQERPGKIWRATFKEDLKTMGVTWREAKRELPVTAADGRNVSSNVPDGIVRN